MVYSILIFPQSSGYVDAAIVDLIEQIDNQVNPVLAIIAETIRSLNYCKRKGKGDFIGYVQLLYIWIRSHFWGKCEVSLKFCMSTMVPIREFYQKEWPKNQTREQWVAALRDLDPAHMTWKAPWMSQGNVLYRCGDKMWVPLLGLWGVISYAPLLVCRQYASEQFIPATHGLNLLDNEFSDPMLELLSLKHTSTDKEFYEEFESLLNLLQLLEDYALNVFVSNLKPDIS